MDDEPRGHVLPTVESPAEDVEPGSPATVAAEGDAHALADVRQLGLVAALGSLGYVFWICGGMEMIERLAFYGVKSVATLYAKAPVSEGGLGITLTSFGIILSTWALVQTIVPAFTGGLSDRYGYKETIFAATVIKISGYLTMGLFPTFTGFFVGAILLATGTAIFKPGIQGTLVKATSRENSSMAWGVFYQTVNIGGYIGPLVAGYMLKLEWKYVFFTCAGVICINFLFLLTYKEPDKEERLARARAIKAGKLEQKSLWRESLQELKKPHVWTYLLVFSGFWFMFNSLFDVLPAHIDDWVNTHDIIVTLFGHHGPQSAVVKFFVDTTKDGMRIRPEGMLNLDAGMIMTTCFLFAWVSGKMRATTSMIVGTLISTAALFMVGYSVVGWIVVFAIVIFSVGEMLSSPKFSEFIGNIAPSDKKAMYLGFSQVPIAVGWTLEGFFGPFMYDHWASKDRFSRELLIQRGMPAAQVHAIKHGDAFSKLVAYTHDSPAHLTEILRNAHHVGAIWIVMGGVGVISAIGLYAYARLVRSLAAK